MPRITKDDVAVSFGDHWIFKYEVSETLLTDKGPSLLRDSLYALV